MKRKVVISIAFAVGLLICSVVALMTSHEFIRLPASQPRNYESLSACEKQRTLWEQVENTEHKTLPELSHFNIFDLLSMALQSVKPKGRLVSDFAPPNWKKYIHRRGAVAKIKIVPVTNNYTGLFQGAECGLLRLSLTSRPTQKRSVAPGLALKVLRDSVPSANISALVSLDGQGNEFNFFRFSMSNIVPTGTGTGQKLVHRVFKSASRYPEELLAHDIARTDAQGANIEKPIAPRQLFFVPNRALIFASGAHEVREDFRTIPEGTIIYRIHALSEKYANFDYSNYTPDQVDAFIKDSKIVAKIVTTSKFLASRFGDEEIFFRHQLRL